MGLSDLYIVLFALVYAMLAGVGMVGAGMVDIDFATLLTGIFFILFVTVGVVVRDVLGIDW